MADIKRQTASEVERKAAKARLYAGQKPSTAGMFGGSEAESELQEAAMNLSRGKAKGIGKVGRAFSYPTKEESAAAVSMQNQRAAELERSAARAKSAERRSEEESQYRARRKALTGTQPNHYVTDSNNHTKTVKK